MKLTELKVDAFLRETASESPAPGGGSVSALAGALASALAGMVANLTQGEKFADVAEKMREIAASAEKIRKELEESVQKDTESFDAYMAALHLPKGTEEEKERRKASIQEALKGAVLVPLETAQTAQEIFPLLKVVLEKGNANAQSDALVASMLAKTAVHGALLNVKINLGGICDEAFCQKMHERVQEMWQNAENCEKELLAASPLSE